MTGHVLIPRPDRGYPLRSGDASRARPLHMTPSAAQSRDTTSMQALATMLAAAVVLSVGVAGGSLGAMAPAAAVNAVFMGGITTVSSPRASHPSVVAKVRDDRPAGAYGRVDPRMLSVGADRISIAGPSGPAASSLPPPHAG